MQRKYVSKMLMLLNFKIKIRLLGFLLPTNDNKFVTFYKDFPIKVPGKGTCQSWFLINNSFIIRWGGLYNPWSVCGDGGANLVYLSLAY